MQIHWKDRRTVEWSWGEATIGFISGVLTCLALVLHDQERRAEPVPLVELDAGQLELRVAALEALATCDSDEACAASFDRVTQLSSKEK